MNDDLTWHFDIAVIEWLIVLAMLSILAMVGAVATCQSSKEYRKLIIRSGTPDSISNSRHTERVHTVLESLDTTSNGQLKEEDRYLISNTILNNKDTVVMSWF